MIINNNNNDDDDEYDEYNINIDGASSATTTTTAKEKKNYKESLLPESEKESNLNIESNININSNINLDKNYINLEKSNNNNNQNNNNEDEESYYDSLTNSINSNNNNNNNNEEKEYFYFKENLITIHLNKILFWIQNKPPQLWSVVHGGIGFLFIFMGYNPVQSLISNIHEKDGSIGLTLIYLFFATSCFLAPSVVKKIGLIKSLFISAFIYAIFIFCSIDKLSILFLPASIAIGLAAGVLWCAQPVYVTLNAQSSPDGEKSIGLYSGIFQSINSMGGIVGNAISGTMRTAKVDLTIILCTLGLFTVLGSIILIFLRNVKSTIPQPKKSIKRVLISTFMIFKDKKFQLAIPLFLLQGQSQAYFNESINNLIGIERVGFTSLVFGIVSVMGASMWGKIHDMRGKVLMQYILAVLYLISLTLSFIAYHFNQMPLFYVIAAINGCFDSLQTILIFVTIASLYPVDNVAAFSAARFLMSISTAIAFFSFKYIPFFAVLFWLLFLLIASQIAFTNLMKNINNFTNLQQEQIDISNDIIVNNPKNNHLRNHHHHHHHHHQYNHDDSFDSFETNDDDKI